MADLFADENFPMPVIEQLRELGHDVLTVAEAGYAGKAWPDEDVLRFASEQERCVLTFNRRHFVRLHLDTPEHHGIIVCTVDPDFEALAQRVHDAIGEHSTLQSILIRINRPTT